MVKFLVRGLGVLALVVVGIWIFSQARPAAFMRTYYGIEQWFVEHSKERWAEKYAATAVKWRLLKPTRIEVEPGISLLLDPRDLVAIDILRGGAWQPEVWDSVAARLGEGAVLLDVGAHIGTF